MLRREGVAGLYRGVLAMAIGAGCVLPLCGEAGCLLGLGLAGTLRSARQLKGPAPAPAGPATRSTLHPTRQPSSCTGETRRDTTP